MDWSRLRQTESSLYSSDDALGVAAVPASSAAWTSAPRIAREWGQRRAIEHRGWPARSKSVLTSAGCAGCRAQLPLPGCWRYTFSAVRLELKGIGHHAHPRARPVSLARTIMLSGLRRVRGGRLEMVEPEGKRLASARRRRAARALEVHDRAPGARPDRQPGMGEAYIERWWDCDDLVTLVRIGARNMAPAGPPGAGCIRAPAEAAASGASHATRSAPRAATSPPTTTSATTCSRPLLDESMMYSSAVFPDPDVTLAEAQEARLERICRQLELTPRTTCSRSAPAGARSRPRGPQLSAAA